MPDALAPAFAPRARAAIESLEYSRIREVTNLAIGRTDIVRLWVGEPDQQAPRAVRDALVAALDAGRTFYGPNLGEPDLRAALAAYHSRLRAKPVTAERICVAASGMSAMNLAFQAVLSPGDRVVTPTPAWPNGPATIAAQGGVVETVPLALDGAVWTLDLDRLLAAITPGVRAVLINSPANPTGWVMPAADQAALLEHCRRLGVWLLSDEVYGRIHYDDGPAPSLLDLAEPEDRVIVIESFSKTWAMTGWRLGWLVAPPALTPDIAKLIEINLSCAPPFVQAAGIAAVSQEDFVADALARYRRNRDLLAEGLARLPGWSAARPKGAFYAFVRVAGCDDSLALAKRILAEARVGVAPGIAFGAAGEGHLRLCFGSPEPQIIEALDRLSAAFA